MKKKIATDPQAPRIEVGSPEMEAAFQAGLEYYTPTAGGHEMATEGGITEVSLNNLRILTQEGMCGKVRSIELGPNHTVFVRMGWGRFETYLATGFSWHYRGEGPHGLAQFASEQGFGTSSEILEALAGLPNDFRGVLFSR